MASASGEGGYSEHAWHGGNLVDDHRNPNEDYKKEEDSEMESIPERDSLRSLASYEKPMYSNEGQGLHTRHERG